MDEEKAKTVDPNPWHERKDFPNWRETRLIPAAVLFLLSCLSFPLSAVRFAPILIAPFLIGGMGWLTWKRHGGFLLTLAFAAILYSVPVWGASFGFLILAASVGVFSGAYLFTVQGRPYLPLAGAAIAFAVSWAITKNPITACLSFLPIPAAFLLGFGVLFGERRLASIAFATVGLFLPLGAVAVWYVIHQEGAFNASAILSITTRWKESLNAFLTEHPKVVRWILPKSASDAGTTATVLGQAVSPAAIKTFNLIPAILIVVCEIPAFLAQKLLTSAYTTNRLGRVVGLESEIFAVGLFTVILWLFTFLLSLFGTPTANLFFATIENVHYLLLPVVIVPGIGSVKQWYLHASVSSRMFLGIMGAALLRYSPLTMLSLLGLFGAYGAIMQAIRRALLRKIQGQFRGGDDQNGE